MSSGRWMFADHHLMTVASRNPLLWSKPAPMDKVIKELGLSTPDDKLRPIVLDRDGQQYNFANINAALTHLRAEMLQAAHEQRQMEAAVEYSLNASVLIPGGGSATCALGCWVLIVLMSATLLICSELNYMRFYGTLYNIVAEVKEVPGCEPARRLDHQLIHLACNVTSLPDFSKDSSLDVVRPLLTEQHVPGSSLAWHVEVFTKIAHKRNAERNGLVTERPQDSVQMGWAPITAVKNSSEMINPLPPWNVRSGRLDANPAAILVGVNGLRERMFGLSLKLRDQIASESSMPLFRLGTRATEQFQPGHGSDIRREHLNVCQNGMVLSTEDCGAEPRLGAVRMAYKLLRPKAVSVISGQVAVDTLEYDSTVVPPRPALFPNTQLVRRDAPSSVLGLPPVVDAEILYDGLLSADDMIQRRIAESYDTPWDARGQACLLLAVGLFILLGSSRQAATIMSLGGRLPWHRSRRSNQPLMELADILLVAAVCFGYSISVTFSLVGLIWLILFPVEGFMLVLVSIVGGVFLAAFQKQYCDTTSSVRYQKANQNAPMNEPTNH